MNGSQNQTESAAVPPSPGLEHVAAVLSMLHEPVGRWDSANRLFRGRPVLSWTLQRLRQCRRIETITVACWDDQVDAVSAIAEPLGAYVLPRGARQPAPEMLAISASRRWSDGWRGGLLGTCEFDRGYWGPCLEHVADQLDGDGILLVDPSAGLVDPALVDALIDHASQHGDAELCFSQAAPGLSATLIRPDLVKRLTSAKIFPGKLLTYLPDKPCRDPIANDSCVPVPTVLARTTQRFTMDSQRQVERLERATVELNGELLSSPSQRVLKALNSLGPSDSLPREIVLEINTARATRPIWWAGSSLKIERPAMGVDQARAIFAELAVMDDIRLTLAGVGDPLLSEHFMAIVQAARDAGIAAVRVETDLLGVEEEQLKALAEAPVDVVSFHVPACTAQTYANVMGVDGLKKVIDNLRALTAAKLAAKTVVPLLAPVFVKCRANVAEMEGWYDQWLRALGSAVIAGPSDYAGQIADVSVADMAPPGRRPCWRLDRRMTILSDGRIVACEQDVLGAHAIGQVGKTPIREVWTGDLAALRMEHVYGAWDAHPLCANCREWHRP